MATNAECFGMAVTALFRAPAGDTADVKTRQPAMGERELRELEDQIRPLDLPWVSDYTKPKFIAIGAKYSRQPLFSAFSDLAAGLQ